MDLAASRSASLPEPAGRVEARAMDAARAAAARGRFEAQGYGGSLRRLWFLSQCLAGCGRSGQAVAVAAEPASFREPKGDLWARVWHLPGRHRGRWRDAFMQRARRAAGGRGLQAWLATGVQRLRNRSPPQYGKAARTHPIAAAAPARPRPLMSAAGAPLQARGRRFRK